MMRSMEHWSGAFGAAVDVDEAVFADWYSAFATSDIGPDCIQTGRALILSEALSVDPNNRPSPFQEPGTDWCEFAFRIRF